MAKRPSLWLGWSGDVTDTPPPPERRHSRRTEIVGVALTPALHAGFYAGFANSLLWPLFHYRLGLVEYRRADYAAYIEANEWIASALMNELRPDDTIWVHDYHLIPLAKILRARGVANPIGYFLHIPFPATEVFRCLPVYRDLV
ncbi:MAG: trehalose-6-phosphate synthase, partial [Alphaproteobacteria bacterium]|nr:trehalose-6-phosphate synthase [Alphaproteobacteria bacterium]